MSTIDERQSLKTKLAEMVSDGIKWQEAAKEMGLEEDFALDLVSEPDFTEIVAKFIPDPKAIRTRFASLAGIAVEKIAEDLHSDSWKARQAAAKEILSQAGFGHVKRVEIAVLRVKEDHRDTMRRTLKTLLPAMKSLPAPVIDAEVVDGNNNS